MRVTLMDVLRDKHAEAAPGTLYQQSWARTITLAGPVLRAEETARRPSEVLADGAGALAIAVYLIAASEGIDADRVTREQVEALLDRSAATGVILESSTLAIWEARLRALGHDPDSPSGDDAVIRHWQALRTDNSPPEDASDGIYFDSLHRWGPGFTEGLHAVLAPPLPADLLTFYAALAGQAQSSAGGFTCAGSDRSPALAVRQRRSRTAGDIAGPCCMQAMYEFRIAGRRPCREHNGHVDIAVVTASSWGCALGLPGLAPGQRAAVLSYLGSGMPALDYSGLPPLRLTDVGGVTARELLNRAQAAWAAGIGAITGTSPPPGAVLAAGDYDGLRRKEDHDTAIALLTRPVPVAEYLEAREHGDTHHEAMAVADTVAERAPQLVVTGPHGTVPVTVQLWSYYLEGRYRGVSHTRMLGQLRELDVLGDAIVTSSQPDP